MRHLSNTAINKRPFVADIDLNLSAVCAPEVSKHFWYFENATAMFYSTEYGQHVPIPSTNQE